MVNSINSLYDRIEELDEVVDSLSDTQEKIVKYLYNLRGNI